MKTLAHPRLWRKIHVIMTILALAGLAFLLKILSFESTFYYSAAVCALAVELCISYFRRTVRRG